MKLEQALRQINMLDSPIEPEYLYAVLYVRTNTSWRESNYIVMDPRGYWTNVYRDLSVISNKLELRRTDFDTPREMLVDRLLNCKGWRVMTLAELAAFHNQPLTASERRKAWYAT